MAIINFEFKAIAIDVNSLEQKLLELSPTYIGQDFQKDTYFNVPTGRLKLREGNIENALIYYERKDTESSKQSNILLYQHTPSADLKEILIKLHGIKVVVNKKRKIYFIDNVKFHFDMVEGLGNFIEVEAIDKDGEIRVATLKQQCDKYASLFSIRSQDYIKFSYSDLLLQKINNETLNA